MTNTYTIIKPTIAELIEAIDLYKRTIEFFNSRKEKSVITYSFTIEELKDKTWKSNFKMKHNEKNPTS